VRAVALAIVIGAFIIESGLAKIAGEDRRNDGDSAAWGGLWIVFLLLLIIG
jgi:hypothetical protein